MYHAAPIYEIAQTAYKSLILIIQFGGAQQLPDQHDNDYRHHST